MNLSNEAAQLISLVERVERLDEELDVLKNDRKEVFGEAKSAGYDTAILKKAIRLRKIPKAERDEADAVLDLYMSALERMEEQAFKENMEAGE